MTASENFWTALGAATPRIGIFFRLDISPPFRFWLGIGDCSATFDATDGSGATYSGLGEILDVPPFQQLINGVADRVQFRLSYVSSDVAALASSEADAVKGTALRVGLGVFGGDWQLIENPVWLKSFTVDFLSIERDQSGDQAVWTVSLSARSLFTGRRRPGLSFFTNDDQKARYPTDRFCERVSIYSVDAQKPWPRFS